jgi:hypothetical protein
MGTREDGGRQERLEDSGGQRDRGGIRMGTREDGGRQEIIEEDSGGQRRDKRW